MLKQSALDIAHRSIHQCKRNLKSKLFEFTKWNRFLWCWFKSQLLSFMNIFCVIQPTIKDEEKKKIKTRKYWLSQERKRFCSFRRFGIFNKINRLWVNIERNIIEAELMAERCTVIPMLTCYCFLFPVQYNAEEEIAKIERSWNS